MRKSIAVLTFNFIAHMLGLGLTVWLLWNIETRFFPVVTDFKVTEATLTTKGLLLSGTINKTRNCELVSMSISKLRDGHPSVILEKESTDLFVPDSSIGLHMWGPLTLPVDLSNLDMNDKISVVALHRCHSLWLQRTEYSRLLWKELKGIDQNSHLPTLNRIQYSMRFI